MNALELLHNRVSSPVLEAPAPTDDQLAEMLKAACRAPDHANLKPYRFIKITGTGLEQLGALFVQAEQAKGSLTSEQEARLRKMPLRAPMILVAVASLQTHPKVPAQEQIITAGCAVHAMQLAAFSMGLGLMWRTGDLAHSPVVAQGLGLSEQEQLIGFLYAGTPHRLKEVPDSAYENLLTDWQAAP